MELTTIDFSSRIEFGRRYFEQLRQAFQADWHHSFAHYEATEQPPLLGLVLIHPAWNEGQPAALGDIRGGRSFGRLRAFAKCQSRLLWGYSCDGVSIETDHMFPFSLGGPTRADNGLTLCMEHNRLKGHDVHLIPWETYQFPWLSDQLRLMRSRHSER